MSLWRCLPVLIAAVLYSIQITGVNARIQARSNDKLGVLNNVHGQTPCALMSAISAQCTQNSPRYVPNVRRDAIPPIPTTCTCNNVFFNLWSACVLSEEGGTPPDFSNWTTKCKSASVTITDGYEQRQDIDIPLWAFISVPSSDSKFHIDDVVTMLNQNPVGWPIMAKIAPVISAVGTLAILVVISLIYRSESAKGGWLTEIRQWLYPHIHRLHRVRKAKRDNSWSIDVMPSMSHEDELSSKTHTRLSSSDTIHTMGLSTSAKLEEQAPNQSIWQKSQIAQRLRNVSNPFYWRDRAITVQPVTPGRRFRVDSWDHSTQSGHSAAHSSNQWSTNNAPAGSSLAHQTIPELDEEYSDFGSIHGSRASKIEEEAFLISPESRSDNEVFLITNRQGDFTLESGSSSNSRPGSHHINVIPPTPSASSHSSPVKLPKLSPLARLMRSLQLPPPPTGPAPTPPMLPPRVPPQLQRLTNESLSESMNMTSQPPHTYAQPSHQPHYDLAPPNMLPMPTAIRAEIPRISAPRPRQQMPTVEEDNSSTSQRNTHQQRRPLGARKNTASPASMESSRYTEYTDYSHSDHPLDPNRRTTDPLRNDLSTMHSPPRIHRQLSMEEEMERSFYSSSTASEQWYMGPSSPRSISPLPHRRVHSAESAIPDIPSSSHVRSLSAETNQTIIPSRADPVMLFPGPVRGAGYGSSLLSTSRSSSSLYSDSSYPYHQT